MRAASAPPTKGVVPDAPAKRKSFAACANEHSPRNRRTPLSAQEPYSAIGCGNEQARLRAFRATRRPHKVSLEPRSASGAGALDIYAKA